MLVEKMYVRCPADKESMTDPRVFVCGQITKVDQFKKTVKVRIYDPLSYGTLLLIIICVLALQLMEMQKTF